MRTTKTNIMQGVECERSRLIANNTVEYYRKNGDRVIRLHYTDIIIKRAKDKALILNSGGWQTVTTKDRMNNGRPFPARVYSIDGLWFISWHGQEYAFADGITLYPDGRVTHAGNHRNAKKLKAQINAFCKKVAALDELPKPGPGDCWGCSMFNARPPVTDRAARNYQETKDPIPGSMDKHPDCLIEHMREGYIHGSLIVNAMRWAGYGDVGIGMAFAPEGVPDMAIRSLRRYLKRQLGLPA